MNSAQAKFSSTAAYKRMRPSVGSASRVYAIGDIHGRHDLMMAILDKILDDATRQPDARRVKIVFLGDYIDRGDHGAKVIEALSFLSMDIVDRIVVLRGNHEDALLNFLASPLLARGWLDFGARQTLADYGVRPPPRKPTDDDLFALRDTLAAAMGPHIEFLNNLPYWTSDGDVIFTHAGLDPNDAETLTNTKAMLWGHPASISDVPVAGKLLVHGHIDAERVVDRPGRICVDTGAYYSGTLTAVRLDDDVNFLTVKSA